MMDWLSDSPLASLLLLILVKAGIVVLTAAGVCRALPRGWLEGRLMVWRSALATLWMLPLLSWWLPVVPLIHSSNTPAMTASVPLSTGSMAPQAPSLPWEAMVLTAYGLGVAAALLALCSGLVSLRRLRRSARPADRPPLPGLINALAAALGLGRGIDVRWSQQLNSPLSWGLRRPRILLPEAWQPAEGSLLRSALAHELAHVRRLDWIWMLLSRGASVLYWCNPLVSWMNRRLSEDTEMACDRLALRVTDSPANYARALLESASKDRQHVAMAMNTGSIRRRIEHLMDSPERKINMKPFERVLLPWLIPALMVPLAACQLTQAAEPPSPTAMVAPSAEVHAPSAVADASAPDVDAPFSDAAIPSDSPRVVPDPPAPVSLPDSVPSPGARPAPVAIPSSAPRAAIRPTPMRALSPSPSPSPSPAPLAVPSPALAPTPPRAVVADSERQTARMAADAARREAEQMRRESARQAEQHQLEAEQAQLSARAAQARAAEMGRAREEARSLDQARAKMQVEIAELARERQTMDRERETLEQERDRLHDELQMADKSVEQLKSELEELRRELEAREKD